MNYNSNKNKYLLKDINLDDIFIDKNIVLKFLGMEIEKLQIQLVKSLKEK